MTAIITLLRKPFKGTVANNTLTHGCGGLNIDASRIPTDENLKGGAYALNPTPRSGRDVWFRFKRGGAKDYQSPSGRWAANLLVIEGSTLSRDKISRYFQHFRHEG